MVMLLLTTVKLDKLQSEVAPEQLTNRSIRMHLLHVALCAG